MRKKTGQSMLPTLHDKKCPATMKELPFDKCTNDDSSGPGPNNDNDDGDGDNDDKCCKKRRSKTPEKFKNKCPRGMIEMPLDKCTNDDSSGPGPNNDNDDDKKKCCKSKNAKSPSLYDKKCPPGAYTIEYPLDKCTNDDSSGPGPNNDEDDNGKKKKCCKPMRKKTGQSMLPTLHDKKCPATMKELPFDKCTN